MDHAAPIIHDPLRNRGTAFTTSERQLLHLTGWLPPRVETLEEQAARALDNVRSRTDPLDRYAYLAALQNENETLFFRVMIDNLQELLPIVYTPTVGQACLEWSRLYLKPRGIYLAPEQAGSIADILRSSSQRDIGIIVVTDGGRILGLGDLGINGMGIPIGKLALYTACAGVPPERCLPVTLDAGTDTVNIREDRLYLGRRTTRLSGDAYDAFIEEFVDAVRKVFPDALVQFEDFNNANAFRILARYRGQLRCFNDDIQGTGAMALAGLLAANRITKRELADERIMFVGAGEAALGVGSIVVGALQREGLSGEQARSKCLFTDSKGTVVASRTDLPPHKRLFAQACAPFADLVATIEAFRPTVLFGACGKGGIFTRVALETMAKHCAQPVVFALSNPTSKSECTAEQAYAWTEGRAIFASGSPFQPVAMGGRQHAPGQANNSYVFPGVGLGVLIAGAKRVTDAMFFAAAGALANQVTDEDLAVGRIFPPATRMRKVAHSVAAAVARVAFEEGNAIRSRPNDIGKAVQDAMYWPAYASDLNEMRRSA